METIVQELVALQADVAECDPTVREQTAAAAFLAQFYNGVENILKRLSIYLTYHCPRVRRGMLTCFGGFAHCRMPHFPIYSMGSDTQECSNQKTEHTDHCYSICYRTVLPGPALPVEHYLPASMTTRST